MQKYWRQRSRFWQKKAGIFRLRYSATMYSQMRWWKQGILTAIISSIPLIWTALTRKRARHLVNVGEIHYEPLGIYGGTESDLANISDGATIAVPNDTTNEARALLLLQDNGIITLKDGAGMEATKNDIAENPHNVEIIELEAAQVARVIEETSFVVLNGNYALQAGLNAQTDALAYETSDSEAAKTYVNVVVVKEGNEGNEGVKALVEVLKSDEISNFINEKYQGSVVPLNNM